MSPDLLRIYLAGIILVGIAGLYYLLATTHQIRLIIGLELITKALTVGLILAGRLTGKMGLAQSMVITLIVIEVVVMVVATGFILSSHRLTGQLDRRNLRNIKG
jgi:multisubunit Na+/H+ antiporter MnhC subunit